MAVAAVLRLHVLAFEEKMLLLWTKSAGMMSTTDIAGLEYVQTAALESVAWTSNQYWVPLVSPVTTTPIVSPIPPTTAASVLIVYCLPTVVPVAAALHAGGAPVPYATCHLLLRLLVAG